MTFMLNIKLGAQPAIPIEVTETDSIQEVKLKICEKKALNPDTTNLKIIFQGQELGDRQSIQECDLEEFSVLYAVVIRQSEGSNHDNASTSSRQQIGLNLVSSIVEDGDQARSLQSSQKRCMYYIYCKCTCKGVRSARLRVRCAQCKQDTLKMDREPSGWRDVMIPRQISGLCLQDTCHGTDAEFYFKCNGHAVGDTDSGLVVLNHITANIYDHSCLTCCDTTASPVLVFWCQPSHVVCLPCFEEYCRTRLNERRFVYSDQYGYTLGCPDGCADSLIEESHHFRLLGDVQYDRYQTFATEECLLHQGGVMCPAPGCGEGLFPGDVRRVQCVREGCMFVFCQECREAYHEGECGEMMDESHTSGATNVVSGQSNQDPEEFASMQTISTTTKPCPKCKVPVEKSGGCMHMVCTRCDFGWCWLCHTEWNRDCQGAHWFG